MNSEFVKFVEDSFSNAMDEIAGLLQYDTEDVDYPLVAMVARAYADMADLINEIKDYVDTRPE